MKLETRPAAAEKRQPMVTDRLPAAASEEQLWSAYARRRDARLRERLVERYRRLAYTALKQLHCTGNEDLEQVALLGLIEAIDRFDPTSGHHFSSFALPTILGELRHYLRDQSRLIRCPRPLFDLRAAVIARRRNLRQQIGRDPSLAEIARDLGTDLEHVVEAMATEDICHPASFDQAPSGQEEDRSPLSEECLGAEDPELARVEERIGWRQVLEHLDPRLREVIELRYYQNLSQERAAGRLGVSQMQVSRLERRAIDRLRCQMAAR
jgi:RNA polymerase sigma-B factor